ncbi:99bce965-631c-44f7-95f8-0eff69d9f1d0 [Sclerotinia trifoliorum]|uniref:99bce965-631c-44f7-95f8-0eff69d9f1d0 n=1 Tax=Sclerotinia trifoliorum TaxID=28548 RepID=A0A8H2ZSJ9_9HELO|nr:99bce965-631c-44f7-95f8-0eff69d9f1d0 [Sclerotinia trifoliorum]
MHSPEYLLGLAKINPELDEILKKTPVNRRFDGSTNFSELRNRLKAAKKDQVAATTALLKEISFIEEDRQIPVRDGSSIDIRIHRPKTPPSGGSPVFVIYHGGGFCLGGLDNESLLCRQWTDLGGVAVNVDYRLAPEHPFPTGVNDAFDALKWTASNLDELHINPSKGFLVGGISAGANFASIVSHLYRDENLSPPLTGVYLSIPPIISQNIVPEKYKPVYLSQEQNKNAPLLNREVADVFDKHYAVKEPSSLATPILFPSHKNLPKTYFQICGLDPLRDEGFIYEDILKENGVQTLVHVYEGLPHGFWTWFHEAEFTRAFNEDCKKGLIWLLETVE